EAVTRATRDPARRVRRVAVGLCALLTEQPGVADRLREIIEDPGEITKIGRTALTSLVSSVGRPFPETVQRFLTDLLQADSHRAHILLRLLQQRLDDSARAILREVVRTGTKREAVAAT